LKDLIIIDGRNLYPQDIELTVEQSHPAMRPGGCAAFSVDINQERPQEPLLEERLIVVAEVERRYQSGVQDGQTGQGGEPHLQRNGRAPLDVDTVVRAIRRAVAQEHDVRAHAVLLLRAGSIPRTPSGKVQRRVCRTSFLAGTLDGLE